MRFIPCDNCTNVARLCDECFERIAAPARAEGMPEHQVAQLRQRMYLVVEVDDVERFVHYPLAETVEERTVKILERKRSLMEMLQGGQVSYPVDLSWLKE